MYTPYEGESFLGSYVSSRMASIERCKYYDGGAEETDHALAGTALAELDRLISGASRNWGKRYRELLGAGIPGAPGEAVIAKSSIEELAETLEGISPEQPVATLDLLRALIANDLCSDRGEMVRSWIDRLVQRFEVTKKLYGNYMPGFRRGEGSSLSIGLYWLFGLLLCLFYARGHEIRYLNTLLKVCDLLGSLPEHELHGQAPGYGLSTVFAAEIVYVRQLAERKGISIVPR